MRKTLTVLLCLSMMLPITANGERLVQSVSDSFVCDAEIPEEIPDTLPTLIVQPIEIDADLVIELLKPEGTPVKNSVSGDIEVGIGDGASERLVIETNGGRIYYTSEFASTNLLNLLPNSTAESTAYLPSDLDLDFMKREEAIVQAVDFLNALGIETADEARVYTLERESFARMQEAMKESEWLANTKRDQALRLLEPLPEEHEGYFVMLTPTVNDWPFAFRENRYDACVLITRRGIEYVETGFVLRTVREGEYLPIIPPEEALVIAAGGPISLWEGKVCTIEWISLIYNYDYEKSILTPVWVFDYCSHGVNALEKLRFDKPMDVYGIGVNAYTGRIINDMMY